MVGGDVEPPVPQVLSWLRAEEAERVSGHGRLHLSLVPEGQAAVLAMPGGQTEGERRGTIA
jgi:hypothetical protein